MLVGTLVVGDKLSDQVNKVEELGMFGAASLALVAEWVTEGVMIGPDVLHGVEFLPGRNRLTYGSIYPLDAGRRCSSSNGWSDDANSGECLVNGMG